MNNKKHIPDNIDSENTFFQGHKKDNPFIVPNDYFENLSLRIADKCTSKKANPLITLRNYFLLKPAFSITLGFIIIALAFGLYFIVEKNQNNNILTAAENLYDKSIEDYLIENENIDDSFIIDAIADDSTSTESIFIEHKSMINGSMQEKEVENTHNSKSDTTISKEDIINYLFEENIDPNDL
jgi:hypothetical protein